jgi:hypothetical protein
MPTTAILFTLSTLAATPITPSMSSKAMARCPIHFISNFAALDIRRIDMAVDSVTPPLD